MKRVQMILEEWQHDWLTETALQKQVSMSSLLRDLLSEAIEMRQAAHIDNDPLWGIVGLGAGPSDGVTSSNLDTFLYQTDWRPKQALKAAEARVAEEQAGAEYDPNHR